MVPDQSSSLVRQARIAGVCYLLVIAGGMFAALFARDPLIVSGDATATASAIAANESLWRWGIAVHSLYLLPGIAFAVILYRIFKPVHATLALLALVFAIVPVAVEALLLTSLYVPLAIIEEGTALSALNEGQRHALGYLAVRLFLTGWGFGLLIFSGFCAIIGFLILHSRLIPRAIGVLMIAAGASYLLGSLAGVLSLIRRNAFAVDPSAVVLWRTLARSMAYRQGSEANRSGDSHTFHAARPLKPITE